MNITIFTSNNARHLSLIERLASVADTVYAVQEAMTIFPGAVDDFFRKTPVMQSYFERVIAAERLVFGEPRFLPENVRQLVMRTGDLSRAKPEILGAALRADIFIVFGASYIRPPLVDLLIDRHAINIHMGVSPYYRGSSCNFWALYDGHPDLVGATIHRLSRGLDNGDILFHALPALAAIDPFELGMRAVEAAQDSLIAALKGGHLLDIAAVPQDRSLELRYTRNSDFNDAVAASYLNSLLEPGALLKALQAAPSRPSIRPFHS